MSRQRATAVRVFTGVVSAEQHFFWAPSHRLLNTAPEQDLTAIQDPEYEWMMDEQETFPVAGGGGR